MNKLIVKTKGGRMAYVLDRRLMIHVDDLGRRKRYGHFMTKSDVRDALKQRYEPSNDSNQTSTQQARVYYCGSDGRVTRRERDISTERFGGINIGCHTFSRHSARVLATWADYPVNRVW